MCDKVVDDNPDASEFVPDWYKTQEMCDKVADDFYIALEYKSKEMCDKTISGNPFSLRYVPDQYKTQQMCDKAVADCLTSFKFVPDWFVTSKMVKKLFTDLYANENIIYFKKILVMPHLIIMKWVFLIQILIASTLTIITFMKMILILLLFSDFCLGIPNLKNVKHLKRN